MERFKNIFSHSLMKSLMYLDLALTNLYQKQGEQTANTKQFVGF